MWLLDAHTLKLKNFLSCNVSAEYPYAILSHTWGDEEVSFQDIKDLNFASTKKGFWKIQKTCSQAVKDELDYAWVDTCCIDKTSSSELQEAINSMFEWYARSSKCYAYLADVGFIPSELQKSRWFSRGWTLPELIAPSEVDFYNYEWRIIACRSERSSDIARRTGIDQAMLIEGPIYEFDPEFDPMAEIDDNARARDTFLKSGHRWLGRYSIARRMSWASERETTRIEDRAYSLFGIFGVSMPLLYGEGNRSFVRLQEVIFRTTSDLSLLAWERSILPNPAKGRDDDLNSLFASSPRAFHTCGNLISFEDECAAEAHTERIVSHAGTKLRMAVMPIHINDHEPADFAGILDCYREDDITTATCLKLVSRVHMKMRDSQEDDLESGKETLYLTPYAPLDLTRYGAKERTLQMDILVTEREPIVRDVVLLRQKRLIPPQVGEGSDYFKQLGLLWDTWLPASSPGYIWLRFSNCRQDPPWQLVYGEPEAGWDLGQAVFRVEEGWQLEGRRNDQIHPSLHFSPTSQLSRESIRTRPCLTGAFVLQRADVNESRVFTSFCYSLTHKDNAGGPKGPWNWAPRMFFRVDSARREDIDGLPTYLLLNYFRHKLLLQDVPDDYAAWLADQNIRPRAKGAHLYDGTALYDSSAVAVKPEIRQIAKRWVAILHVHDLTDLSEMANL